MRHLCSCVGIEWLHLILATLLFCYPYAAFIVNEEAARQYVDARKLGIRFIGGGKSQEAFKLLTTSGEYLIIGSRNVLYNISAEDFSQKRALKWLPKREDVDECLMKGKNELNCHNYIRLYAQNTDGTSLICGTNAFKPLCRIYKLDNGRETTVKEFSAVGMLPYDERQNSSFVYLPETYELFSATTADFGGSDPLIYKMDVTKTDSLGLRTDRYNKRLLNEPNFVTSFSSNEFVYFWFREIANEQSGDGKAMYARVARICRNDRGTRRRESWTSFVKARLNCSVPGEFPYYFNELVATSEDLIGHLSPPGSRIIYAVFNSPSNIVTSSAICAYRMDDVERVFAYSDFKTSFSDLTRPIRNGLGNPMIRKPRSCVNDSHVLNDDAVNFMISNPLVKDAVPSVSDAPLFVMLGHSSRFTQIAVHPRVTAASGQEYDVMFIGTDNGRVLKVISTLDVSNHVVPVLIEVITVFPDTQAVTGLFVHGVLTNGQPKMSRTGSPKLVVISSQEIRLLPLYHCSSTSDCSACLNLQDPYCAWDEHNRACVGKPSWSGSEQNRSRMNYRIIVQSKDCPHRKGLSSTAATTSRSAQKGAQKMLSDSDGSLRRDSPGLASRKPLTGSEGIAFENAKYEAEAVKSAGRSESFAIAIPLTFIISALLGFLVGYGCRLSKRNKNRALVKKVNQEPLYRVELFKHDPYKPVSPKNAVINNYVSPVATVGIYDTIPRQSHTLSTSSKVSAGLVRPLTNCNTLPRPQLVRKVPSPGLKAPPYPGHPV